MEVIKDVDINELGLSVRTHNCLRRAGINTVQDIVDNYSRLHKARSLGKVSYKEITEKIQPYVAQPV